ncbi:MAG: PE-PPE domain-containing protein [Gordonia sp. (in: high G+C Gram-positive bacteria)]
MSTTVIAVLVTALAASPGAAVTVLTVAGNGLLVHSPMSGELRGDLCREPNVCTPVDYDNSATGTAALNQGTASLYDTLQATAGQKIVMAYSQGGFITTTWMNTYASDPVAPPANDLSFVLFGNPQRAIGGASVASGSAATPTDTKYKVVDISRQYDSVSDWPDDPYNALAIANAVAGYFYTHTDYTGVDVNDPHNLVKTVGNTAYVLVPTPQLPLLEPLRRIGLTTLADQLNTQLKPIVDAGSRRNHRGFVPETAPVLPAPYGTTPPLPRTSLTSSATS